MLWIAAGISAEQLTRHGVRGYPAGRPERNDGSGNGTAQTIGVGSTGVGDPGKMLHSSSLIACGVLFLPSSLLRCATLASLYLTMSMQPRNTN
jgi:hypothetical protein